MRLIFFSTCGQCDKRYFVRCCRTQCTGNGEVISEKLWEKVWRGLVIYNLMLQPYLDPFPSSTPPILSNQNAYHYIINFLFLLCAFAFAVLSPWYFTSSPKLYKLHFSSNGTSFVKGLSGLLCQRVILYPGFPILSTLLIIRMLNILFQCLLHYILIVFPFLSPLLNSSNIYLS